jgi:hypothetical protein
MKAPTFLAGVLIALGAGWAGFPRAIYQTRPQPVDFSHKVHADKAGTKCDDCHALREDGSFAGVPALEKCSGCHAAPMGSTPAEKAFIDGYVTPNREPRWVTYAEQPANVYFSHAAHVRSNKVKCEDCHGEIGTSDTLRPARLDRVSGYSSQTMRMQACMDCHAKNSVTDSCLECHK